MRLGDDRPPARKGRGKPPARRALRLRAFTGPAELWAAIVQAYHGAPPPQVAGVYMSASDEQATIAFWDSTSGQPRLLGETAVFVWDIEGSAAPARRRPGFGSADEFALVGTAVGGEAQNALRLKLMASALGVPAAGPGDVVSKQIAQRVALLPPFEGDVMYAYEITSAGATVWAGESPFPAPLARCPVTVLTQTVELAADDDAYGRCPPLEGAADSSIWLAALGLLNPAPSVPEPAFLGEPDIAMLPTYAFGVLDSGVSNVAHLLHMSPQPFVGGFVIAAMAHIDRRCRRLMYAGAEPGYQLREMAQAFGPLKQLVDTYMRLLSDLDGARKLPCPLAAHLGEWKGRFWEVYGAARDDAVASMFVTTCQNELLQVLFASGRELRQRYVMRAKYLPLTRQLLTVMFSDTADLLELRRTLRAREALDRVDDFTLATLAGGAGGSAGTFAWKAVADSVLRASADDPPLRDAERGTVVLTSKGRRVYDGKGRWWAGAELDAVIGAQRQEVIGIDPLLDKVTEVEDLVHELQAAHNLDSQGLTGLGAALTSHVDDVLREAPPGPARGEPETGARRSSRIASSPSGSPRSRGRRARQPDRRQALRHPPGREHQAAGLVRRPRRLRGRSEPARRAGDRPRQAVGVREPRRPDPAHRVLPAAGDQSPPPGTSDWPSRACRRRLDHRDLQRAMLGGDAILSAAPRSRRRCGRRRSPSSSRCCLRSRPSRRRPRPPAARSRRGRPASGHGRGSARGHAAGVGPPGPADVERFAAAFTLEVARRT